MAERQPSSHAQWANTTLAPGFWVAVTLRPGAAPLRVYVGRVQAVDERGLRLTLVDWSTGGADSWDVYAPWSEVIVQKSHRKPKGTFVGKGALRAAKDPRCRPAGP